MHTTRIESWLVDIRAYLIEGPKLRSEAVNKKELAAPVVTRLEVGLCAAPTRSTRWSLDSFEVVVCTGGGCELRRLILVHRHVFGTFGL